MSYDNLKSLQGYSLKELYLSVSLKERIDKFSDNIIVVTRTIADAKRQIFEMGKRYLGGEINMNNLYIKSEKGFIIKFIPISRLEDKLHGLRYKEIWFM